MLRVRAIPALGSKHLNGVSLVFSGPYVAPYFSEGQRTRTLTGRAFDRERSLHLIPFYRNLVDADLTPELIGEFVQNHSAKLNDIYGHLAADQNEVFVFQPETLLVFLALERDHCRCREFWSAELPEDLYEHFAAVWGIAA